MTNTNPETSELMKDKLKADYLKKRLQVQGGNTDDNSKAVKNPLRNLQAVVNAYGTDNSIDS